MDLLRDGFDDFYSLVKPLIFKITKSDPEKAHGMFVAGLKFLYNFHQTEE